MENSLERTLGITATCALVFMLFLVASLLGSTPSSQMSVFVSFFVVTAMLNTAVLYWPVHVNEAIKQPITRALLAPLIIGMIVLNIVLPGAALRLPYQTLSFLQDNTLLLSAGLILLALVFLVTHYFLFRFFTAWLSSPIAHAVGVSGFLVAAYLFFFHWMGRWFGWDDIAAIYSNIGYSSRDWPVLASYGFYSMIMQYFFVTIAPYYLVALVAKKRFRVSHWLHVVYLYTGLSGLAGGFVLILYGFTYPGSL